ncbi:uncharacterized protein LOC143151204 isoform X1 [Ptiloglossa arizonensis]|uniref:uncharacterized protein LOC143151204 isoform X1 n=1 Tax=Ptiloglossa arizonensis TaxID=3350558 RepID=UPI003FA0C265
MLRESSLKGCWQSASSGIYHGVGPIWLSASSIFGKVGRRSTPFVAYGSSWPRLSARMAKHWRCHWNSVGRGLPDSIRLMCYAEDTLLLAVGESWRRTIQRAEDGTRHVVDWVREIGLLCAASTLSKSLSTLSKKHRLVRGRRVCRPTFLPEANRAILQMEGNRPVSRQRSSICRRSSLKTS